MIVITDTQKALLAMFQAASGIVPRKSPIPILQNFLVKKTGDTVQVTASDMEIQIRVTKQIPGGADCNTTFDASKVISILKNLPATQTVTLDSDQKLTLKSGKSKFTLQTLPAEDYPQVKEANAYGPAFSIQQKTMLELIEKTAFAMAVHDIRYYLNGMLIVTEGNQLKMVTTDGHRLAFAAATLESAMPSQSAILPSKTVTELKRLLSDKDGTIEMQFSSNQVKFRLDDVELVSKLVEGKFPDYARVIPSNCQLRLTVGRIAMLSALQRVAVLLDDKSKGVRLVLNAGVLNLYTGNAAQEESQDELDVDYAGESLEIGFNISYLLDVLGNMEQDTVLIDMVSGGGAAVFQIPDDAAYKYVVMPMRI